MSSGYRNRLGVSRWIAERRQVRHGARRSGLFAATVMVLAVLTYGCSRPGITSNTQTPAADVGSPASNLTRGSVDPGARPANVLRVCADPNNMPFSNREEQGFENV